jgi:hypothetical protein
LPEKFADTNLSGNAFHHARPCKRPSAKRSNY